ncbi:hypothetical protein [Methylobacter sp.]|uniref:hypothetical protein n=1 Tax=Methylobacter sp. TaxID=2051955 RepID=UPI003DA38DF9
MTKPVTSSEDWATIVAVRVPKERLDTCSLFNSAHDDSSTSPIDQFIENALGITKLWATHPTEELAPEVGILLLLGYVSAVESYMRALVRRLIYCDPFSQECCEKLQLSYGAALHHKADVLPEALLEETVFSGKAEITKALDKFVGFKLNNKSILELLDQYEMVCQLRHCCVHRFGKLGAKNAIALGLQSHKEFLEKPVLLTKSSISSIADLLFVLVKSINNDVFRHVMERSATSKLKGSDQLGIGWTWHKTNDKRLYKRYYLVFSSTKDAQPSPSSDELYERFRKAYGKVGRNS